MKMKGKKIAHCLEAVKLTKQMVKWMESVKSLGPVCGVPIVPRKWSSENSNDCHLEKLIRKPKLMVQTVHNFPLANCGIKESDTKPLRNLTNVHSDVENKKLMGSLRPNKFGHPIDFTGTRPPSGEVKFWDPGSSNNGGADKPKVTVAVTVRKPLQPLNGADSNIVKIKSHVNVKYSSNLKTQSFGHDKLKSYKHAEFIINKPSSSSKPAGNVKSWAMDLIVIFTRTICSGRSEVCRKLYEKMITRFSIVTHGILGKLCVRELVSKWDASACAVMSVYSQKIGGKSFSSRYGSRESYLNGPFSSN